MGWLLPPSAALLWSAFIIATIAMPALLPFSPRSYRAVPA